MLTKQMTKSVILMVARCHAKVTLQKEPIVLLANIQTSSTVFLQDTASTRRMFAMDILTHGVVGMMKVLIIAWMTTSKRGL